MGNFVKVAVIQASPVHFNKGATLARCRELVAEASTHKPDLIVFSESFIPAYPRGLSFGTVIGSRSEKGRKQWERYFANAVDVPGDETRIIEEMSRESGAFISMGITERDGRSLYCTQLLFSPEKGLAGSHRKIKPTAAERIIWAEGDASSLTTYRTDFGLLGTLICWENFMPMARMALYSKGVNIYIAPTADNRDTWQTAIRHIAFEGRCFVISCNQFARVEDYPEGIPVEQEKTDHGIISAGGSAVVAPTGDYIAGPVYGREEILYADLDMDLVPRLSLDLDVAGHYNRPDIFNLPVKELPETTDLRKKC